MTDQTAADALREMLEHKPELAALNRALLEDFLSEEDLLNAQGGAQAKCPAPKPGHNAIRQHPEADFQGALIDLLHIHHWRVAHFRPARTATGWRTAVAADGAGFPDIVAVRDRIIFIECKAPPGKLSPEQIRWEDAILMAQGEHYVWGPDDWPEIERVLAPHADV